MPGRFRRAVTRAMRRRTAAGTRVFRQQKARKLGFNSNFDKVIYPYKQYCDTATLTNSFITSSTVGTNYAWQFTLDMLPQVATFAALYDVYRIAKVEFCIRPRAIINAPINSSQGTLAGGGYLNNVLVAVDHDDANAPTSFNALREYGNAKEYQLATGRPIKFTFVPAVAQQIYNGVVAASGERFAPWIDMGNTNVPHYGVKVAMQPMATNSIVTCDITVRYMIECKQVR